jgi:hypothetical protein
MQETASLRPSRTSLLIIFVISLSAVMAAVANLRIAGYLSQQTQLVVALVVFGLNLAVAVEDSGHRFAAPGFRISFSVSSACFS